MFKNRINNILKFTRKFTVKNIINIAIEIKSTTN